MSDTVGDERRGMFSLLISGLLLDRAEDRRVFAVGLVYDEVDGVEVKEERCTGFIVRSISRSE